MSNALETLSKTELIALLKEREKTLDKLSENNIQLTCESDQLAQKLKWYDYQLKQLKRLLFGAKRERFIPSAGQLSLPFDVTELAEPDPVEEQEIKYKRKKKSNENHPGRNALPAHLPVEETVIEPEDKPEGAKKIGEEISEQLEYKPAELYIKRIIRPKYSLGKEQGVVVAAMPSMPIEKCMAAPGLLTQIMVDKFVDHLPIYRQIQRWKRWEVKLASSTINSWQESVCRLLEPLYNTLKHHVLSEGYLQVDETPIKVLDKSKTGKAHQGYYWVYHSPIRKAVLFDYQKGRDRAGPKAMLIDFKGYLQTDGYSAYDWFKGKNDITMLSCMAHIRRYFEKALDYDKSGAEYAMGMIQKLYALERDAKNRKLSAKDRHTLRLDNALPLVNELGLWIAQKHKNTLPQSPMGKALSYAANRWDNLLNYLNDGSLEIDNNLVENSIRPNALGRKNYLFAGSHSGANRAAMMYSFFGTCKANDINPYLWLKYVLEHIADHKANKLYQLLPYNFKNLIKKT